MFGLPAAKEDDEGSSSPFRTIPTARLSEFQRWVPAISVTCLGVIAGLSAYFFSSSSLKWLVGAVAALSLVTLAAVVGKIRPFLLTLLVFSASLGFGAYVIYIPDHQGVADGITISLSDICLAALFALWAHDVLYLRRSKMFFFKSISIPFLGVLAAATLSLWKSDHFQLSVYGLIDYVKSFAFFFVLANNIRCQKDVQLIFRGLQLNLIIIGAICIAETILGVNFNSSFEVVHPEEWEEFEGLAFRAGGLSTPTYTGGYLASMLPLLWAYLLLKREPAERALSVAALLLGGTGLVLTLTRAAYGSLAFGSMLFLSYAIRKRVIRFRYLIAPVVVLVIIAVGYRDQIISRMAEGEGNLVARAGLIMVASNMILDNPFLGVGINTYHKEMDAYTPNSMPHEFRYLVHNKFLLLWAEIGAIGLFSFLIVWAVAIIQVRNVMRSTDCRNAILGSGLFAALAVFAINMNIEAYAGGALMYSFWLVIALVVGLNGPLYGEVTRNAGR